jgi:hypothetical protein
MSRLAFILFMFIVNMNIVYAFETSALKAPAPTAGRMANSTFPFSFKVPVRAKDVPSQYTLSVDCYVSKSQPGITGSASNANILGRKKVKVPLVNGNYQGTVGVNIKLKPGRNPLDAKHYVCYLVEASSYSSICSANPTYGFPKKPGAICKVRATGNL